ncbi:MAG: TIM barrel protein [Pseudomonadota bacterium]
MKDKLQNSPPADPSRRRVMKQSLAGAAALGGISAVTAAAEEQSARASGRKHRMLASSLIHTGHTEAFTGRTWGNWPFEYRMRQVAEAGFTGVGLLHPDLDHVFRFEAKGASMADKIRWMKSVLDNYGLEDIEIEFLTNWMFPVGDGRRKAEEPVRQMLREMAKIMRPHHLKCGNFAQPEPVEQVRMGFRELCEDFSDTVVAYEVLTNEPYGGDIQTMVHIVEGNDNGGLFFDTWHTNHIDGLSYDDIADLPRGLIKGVELDDGWLIEEKYKPYFEPISAPQFLERTINCRCCLGEGNFDVIGFIQACARAGYDGPWGNEILSQNVQRYPIEMMLPHIYNTSLAHIRNALDGSAIPPLIRSDYA